MAKSASSCVVAAVDFSEVSERVLETAAGLASALGVELVVLYVAAPEPDFVGYDPGPQSVRDQIAGALREEHQRLGELVAALVERGVAARPLMVQGAAAERIVEHAERLGAQLVVLGSHGHGRLHHLIAGSVTSSVLRASHIPVVLVPAHHR